MHEEHNGRPPSHNIDTLRNNKNFPVSGQASRYTPLITSSAIVVSKPQYRINKLPSTGFLSVFFIFPQTTEY
ncbi:hypothetical protein RP20_CCG018964 [Aedes albopictus]|nr:hypothetical protein RP20_CCG018964 [Aedes albopictus]